MKIYNSGFQFRFGTELLTDTKYFIDSSWFAKIKIVYIWHWLVITELCIQVLHSLIILQLFFWHLSHPRHSYVTLHLPHSHPISDTSWWLLSGSEVDFFLSSSNWLLLGLGVSYFLNQDRIATSGNTYRTRIIAIRTGDWFSEYI
jgi:hypothetical protein